MDQASELSDKIRLIRLQKGLSQENMADMMGLSTSAYGDIERGRTELSYARLENISKLLDVPLPELLGFEAQTMTEVEWLRQENARLLEVNVGLQNELDQWKAQFKQWIGQGLIKKVGEQRQRIGF